MAGYSTANVGKTPKVFCAATSKAYFVQLKAIGGQKLAVHVPIVGMAGMLPALAKNYGMEARAACRNSRHYNRFKRRHCTNRLA